MIDAKRMHLTTYHGILRGKSERTRCRRMTFPTNIWIKIRK